MEISPSLSQTQETSHIQIHRNELHIGLRCTVKHIDRRRRCYSFWWNLSYDLRNDDTHCRWSNISYTAFLIRKQYMSDTTHEIWRKVFRGSCAIRRGSDQNSITRTPSRVLDKDITKEIFNRITRRRIWSRKEHMKPQHSRSNLIGVGCYDYILTLRDILTERDVQRQFLIRHTTSKELTRESMKKDEYERWMWSIICFI